MCIISLIPHNHPGKQIPRYHQRSTLWKRSGIQTGCPGPQNLEPDVENFQPITRHLYILHGQLHSCTHVYFQSKFLEVAFWNKSLSLNSGRRPCRQSIP
ncbi:uncharacterized protein LOC144294659 isoform X3 [Canis aureus]